MPQLALVAKVTHLDAKRTGNDSPHTTQATGPQEEAKPVKDQFCHPQRAAELTSDENARERDKDLAGDGLVGVRDSDGTRDALASDHNGGTPEKDRTTSEPVNEDETGERHDKVDGGKDDLEYVNVRETGSVGESASSALSIKHA
jgi:hypothetical protein